MTTAYLGMQGGAEETMIVWPGWCWWLGMIAAACWLVVAILLRRGAMTWLPHQHGICHVSII
jgi:hypothetical protein